MNAINWFEIPTADFARAQAFYERILDLRLQPDSCTPGMRMAVFPHEPGVATGGCLIEHEQSKPNPDGVRVYLNARGDLQGILDRVAGAGGKIVMPKTLVTEEIGSIGMFIDSEGNIVGLHEEPAAA